MSKPISLIVILVVGLILLAANKVSVWKYVWQETVASEEVVLNTENSGTVASTSAKKIEILDHATIIYTDSGFAPAVVTINVGGMVNFVNKSSERNISLSFSPTLPVGSAGQADTLVFLFENAGEFAFFSEGHPERIGVVVVR